MRVLSPEAGTLDCIVRRRSKHECVKLVDGYHGLCILHAYEVRIYMYLAELNRCSEISDGLAVGRRGRAERTLLPNVSSARFNVSCRRSIRFTAAPDLGDVVRRPLKPLDWIGLPGFCLTGSSAPLPRHTVSR